MPPHGQLETPRSTPDADEGQSLLPGDPDRGAGGDATYGTRLGRPRWWRSPLMVATTKNLALILLWYFFGTFLSLWNKLLVGKEHGLFGQGSFPAPFLMSSVQFFFQHFIARSLLVTGLVRRRGEELTWKKYWKTVAPNGVATGLDIGFSNYSLVFITLSFYVMCKSTTPLFLLTFAIIWGIEKPSWSLAGVVLIITCGLLLLVAGETKFDMLGFVLVMSASALAGLRWTITQVLLQGNLHHASTGGPVEVIFQLTPIMGLTMAIFSLGFEQLWATLPSSPYFSSLTHSAVTMAVLGMGGVIAFLMVWAEFAVIANTSALTFLVAGTFKEIVTVGAAVLFLHEQFTLVNSLGLLVLIAGVVLFNALKYQKLRHGEPRPVVLDEGLRFNGGGIATASASGTGDEGKFKTDRSMMVSALNDREDFAGIINGNGSHNSVLQLVRPSSRPPSPHGNENRLRKVSVLQETDNWEIEGSEKSRLWREHSI